MLETIAQSPDLIREYGLFGLLVVGVISGSVYFAPSVKKIIESYPDRKKNSDQLLENNTAALHTCEAALNNNTEALRENKEDRDRVTAILIEHDRKSEIRFDHQNESLGRIENKL